MNNNITITTTAAAAAAATTSVLAPKRLTCLTTLFLELVQNLNNAIDKHDYTKVIDYTTLGIDQLLSKQRIILLDARAYAYSMQSQPDSAIVDAHRMIGHASMSPDGYFRKANVFTMYGKQLQAIEASERIMAQKRNKSQIDFITMLPADIVNVEIIPFFSSSTKAACLTVSKSWRRIIVDCSTLWEQLSVNDNDQETMQLFGMVPIIGCHVNQLSINAKLMTILTACFQFMKDGHFSKMKTLEIQGIGNNNQQEGLQGARIMIGFWKVRQTLTTLDINVGDSTSSVKLVDILLTCTNLVNLKFTTTYPLTLLLGNFSTMEQHSSLIDLEIKSKAITGSDIGILLQRCEQLRRLVLDTCDESVFDVINRYTPNLEILAYNTNFDIEQLQQSGSGNISEAELQNLYITHPDFTLNNIKNLTFWSCTGAQQFIVRSIRNTNTLRHLCVINVHDMDGLIETLMIMPPLLTLKFWDVNSITGRSSLIRLFERYARAVKKSHLTLNQAYFGFCDIISDEILSALTAINTLQKITFRQLINVSGGGINSMFDKLKSQLTYVSLENMNSITDDTIIVIGSLKKLNYLNLSALDYVTDKGIYELLGRLSPMLLSTLHLFLLPIPDKV
ncbi:hypothetical protein INT45_012172 [Circinella minor]|uniref:F-box domain-containing protein n=1 Tax=Circinella minor TaxID=1195481 RepID=A0A8H7SA53_9FUNG|nr:hypothetical protein INT45_012172 [Circinella minor]